MARGEWAATTGLIEAAIAVLETENPMTIRQLFYRLVSRATIENRLPDYQRVSKAMTKARKDGRADYGWIVDRSRSSYHNPGWSGLEGISKAIENALVNYRRDYWQEQPALVEVWCEKDAVTGSIQDLCDSFGVRVEPIRGFDSTTKIHEAGQRFFEALDNGKKLAILYLGDHDPSGRDIERDLWGIGLCRTFTRKSFQPRGAR